MNNFVKLIGTISLGIALAASIPSVSTAQAPENVSATKELSNSVSGFTGMTASMPADGQMDRILMFVMDESGEVLLGGMGVSEIAEPMEALEDDVVAVARVRYGGAKKPLKADGEFVETHGVPLFIIKGGSGKTVEVGLVDGKAVYRKVKSGGRFGDWKDLP